MNGVLEPKSKIYSSRCELVANSLAESWRLGSIVTRIADVDWFRHVYRELNTVADELANRAMDDNSSHTWCCEPLECKPKYLRAWFDGGKRPDTHLRACGWHVEGAWLLDGIGQPVWRQLAYGSILLQPEASTVDAELRGLEQATAALLAVAHKGYITFDGHHVA
eukprot:12360738-Karenia_brevis.AAC.1